MIIIRIAVFLRIAATMNNCPYCDKKAISFSHKFFLGAARSTNCQECGGKIGVPWTHTIIAFSPLVFVFWFTTAVESSSLVLLLIILAGIPMFLLQAFWVPIIKK